MKWDIGPKGLRTSGVDGGDLVGEHRGSFVMIDRMGTVCC